jgi:hypothetical protein
MNTLIAEGDQPMRGQICYCLFFVATILQILVIHFKMIITPFIESLHGYCSLGRVLYHLSTKLPFYT